MGRYPLGGMMSWRLQWLVGLARLGHEVHAVEKADYPNAWFVPGGPCCMDRRCGRIAPDPVLGSGDADGLRASQLLHAVQDLDRHVHLGRLTLVRV